MNAISLPIPAMTIQEFRAHALALIARFDCLERQPGNRSSMTSNRRAEYDLLGAAIADIRNALARLD